MLKLVVMVYVHRRIKGGKTSHTLTVQHQLAELTNRKLSVPPK